MPRSRPAVAPGIARGRNVAWGTFRVRGVKTATLVRPWRRKDFSGFLPLWPNGRRFASTVNFGAATRLNQGSEQVTAKSKRTSERKRGPDGAKWTTVPKLAGELGVDQMKIHAWIQRGELLAVNIAERPNGRPRWRIPAGAWDAFQAARSNQARLPAPRAPRRRKPAQPIIQYY